MCACECVRKIKNSKSGVDTGGVRWMKEGSVFSALLARASASRTNAGLDGNVNGNESVVQQDDKSDGAAVATLAHDSLITTPSVQPRREFGHDYGANGKGADEVRIHAEVFSTPGEGILDATQQEQEIFVTPCEDIFVTPHEPATSKRRGVSARVIHATGTGIEQALQRDAKATVSDASARNTLKNATRPAGASDAWVTAATENEAEHKNL